MMKTIFREKSMQRVSSPEQLNDYIRVAKPGILVTLSAVIILLIGFIVWGVVGTLETKVDTVAVSDSDEIICYIKETEISDIEQGDAVHIGDYEYTVTEILSEPIAVDESFSDYALHIGDLKAGEWVYSVKLNGSLPDGVYAASIVADSISPISFLFN